MSYTNPDGTEVVVTRSLHAPVERVYKAFTDPTDMAAWMWGPLAANATAEVELKVGGRYAVYIDATPGKDGWPGERWGMAGVYALIEPNERLIYTVHWDAPVGYNQVEDGPPVLDEVILIQLTPSGDGTHVEMRHVGIPDDGMSAQEHGKGIDATFDDLARLVEG